MRKDQKDDQTSLWKLVSLKRETLDHGWKNWPRTQRPVPRSPDGCEGQDDLSWPSPSAQINADPSETGSPRSPRVFGVQSEPAQSETAQLGLLLCWFCVNKVFSSWMFEPQRIFQDEDCSATPWYYHCRVRLRVENREVLFLSPENRFQIIKLFCCHFKTSFKIISTVLVWVVYDSLKVNL